MSFVLASASESRLLLLKRMGFMPELIYPSDIDESHFKDEDVRSYARRMSETKARVASMIYPDRVILAADTVAARGNMILPKALTDSDVRQILLSLSGRRHRVYTSISLVIPGQKIRTRIVMTIVKFKRLIPSEVEGYVASKEGIGKAGGYSIQGRINLFVHYIGGSFTNIIGLPMYELTCLFQSAKIYPNWSSDFTE